MIKHIPLNLLKGLKFLCCVLTFFCQCGKHANWRSNIFLSKKKLSTVHAEFRLALPMSSHRLLYFQEYLMMTQTALWVRTRSSLVNWKINSISLKVIHCTCVAFTKLIAYSLCKFRNYIYRPRSMQEKSLEKLAHHSGWGPMQDSSNLTITHL